MATAQAFAVTTIAPEATAYANVVPAPEVVSDVESASASRWCSSSPSLSQLPRSVAPVWDTYGDWEVPWEQWKAGNANS